MTLVVTLRVRRDRLEDFRAFERHAAAVMADHDGHIERTVVAPVEGRADLLAEVHVVTFPARPRSPPTGPIRAWARSPTCATARS